MQKTVPMANPHADLIGRSSETARLLEHAHGNGPTNALALLVAPGCGASEILRHIYDRLFAEQSEIVPVYFELEYEDRDARHTAVRFLREFLLQIVSFRRAANVSDPENDLLEIDTLGMPEDAKLVDRLVETYLANTPVGNARSFIRNCLNISQRAAANGTRCCVLVDGTHVARGLTDGDILFDEIKEMAASSPSPFVLCGLRRHLFGQTQLPTMEIEPLSFDDAGRVVEVLAARSNAVINDETRDLIAVQLGGSSSTMAAYLAGEFSRDLTSFENVERGYTNSIFGGHLGRHFDAIIDRTIPNKTAQLKTIAVLSWMLDQPTASLPLPAWQMKTGLNEDTFFSATQKLHEYELINLTSSAVTLDRANIVLGDYIRSRSRIEAGLEQRAHAVGKAMAQNLTRAPQLMADFYRRNSAIGLRDLMLSFDGRPVSSSLIDYERFKADFRGASDEDILRSAAEDSTVISLPRIIYASHATAFYPRLAEICESERSAVGLGFADASAKGETAWIAAEIDSKLEAARDLTEFWCDRLEMAAESSGLKSYRLWLIAPEGFGDAALAALRDRNAFGSSRKQVDLLARILKSTIGETGDEQAEGDEIIVPMGEEGEMMSARAIDEIAKRHGFTQKATNQIKTAVIEACINAAEHSLSPDQKIHQVYTMDANKLGITISNRGLRLTDKKMPEPTPDGGRRGWGLKLMKSLMDEVRIEQTDDGTRITMVKLLES